MSLNKRRQFELPFTPLLSYKTQQRVVELKNESFKSLRAAYEWTQLRICELYLHNTHREASFVSLQ